MLTICWKTVSFSKQIVHPHMTRHTQNAMEYSHPKTDSFIILMSEQNAVSTMQATPEIIAYVQGLGYRLGTIADCLGDANGYQPTNF